MKITKENKFMTPLPNSVKNKTQLVFAIFALLGFSMLGQETIVSSTAGNGSFGLVTASHTANLVLDDSDYEGVSIAAKNFQKDIERVTSKLPELLSGENSEVKKHGNVIIGTLGKNTMIDSFRCFKDRRKMGSLYH